MERNPERTQVTAVVATTPEGRREFRACWIQVDTGRRCVRIWPSATARSLLLEAPLEDCVIDWRPLLLPPREPHPEILPSPAPPEG